MIPSFLDGGELDGTDEIIEDVLDALSGDDEDEHL